MTEFSRLIVVEPCTEDKVIEVQAEPAERAALAERFGLLSLDRLSAAGILHISDSGRVARLDASIVADVVQSCVVTLDPVASHIEERLSVTYARNPGAPTRSAMAKEIQVRVDEEDEPEPIPDTGIDIGEAVAECLGLALEPYPRAANAETALESMNSPPDNKERESPFAVLEKLKRK